MAKFSWVGSLLGVGSKSADDVLTSKPIGGSGSVKVSKVDPLDPAGTQVKYTTAEPNLKNILGAETSTVKPVSSVVTPAKTLYSVDDAGKIAAKTQANETANNILKQANKNSSVLGSLGKVAAATGIGVLVGGALAGQSSVMNPEGGGAAPGGSDGLPSTVTTATDENGQTYYVYNTGNEGVDDALGWLQQQIDEIIEFLNGLLGGSSGGSGGGAFVTGGDDGSGATEASAGKKMKLIAVIGLVAVVAAAYFLTRRKNGGTKKGGSKK